MLWAESLAFGISSESSKPPRVFNSRAARVVRLERSISYAWKYLIRNQEGEMILTDFNDEIRGYRCMVAHKDVRVA